MMVAGWPGFITIALGIGISSLGFFVLIFLFKFLFKTHKVDRSSLIEIKESDEPELFQLIKEIVNEVGTSLPRKVYLSPDVNAAVFYDSSFWSMFLPIKKNLQIGIGLVNSTTELELKAILAHEFGHFSQRTMKVGSYVYNINQVIFNMLYENESFDNLMHRWAEVSGYFSIFVAIAVKIINGIQWILRKVYEVVNLSYMGLSREMEFQADEIAANVTGHTPLANALLRLDLAEHSYNSVLGYYENKLVDNFRSSNLFKEHSFVLIFLGKDSELKFHNQLPQVTLEDFKKFNKSKLVVKDQWASHPSVEERIEAMEKLNISRNLDENEPATNLFVDIELIQKTLTDKLFESVEYKGEIEIKKLSLFQNEYLKEFKNNTFDKIYKGYYDSKNPIQFDTNMETSDGVEVAFSDMFSVEQLDLALTTVALEADINSINQICSGEFNIKTFDYAGRKYRAKESSKLLEELKKELDSLNERLKQNDINIYKFFIKREELKGADRVLKNCYDSFFSYDGAYEKHFETYSKLMESTQFINETTPFDTIKNNFEAMKKLEDTFKESIKSVLRNELFEPMLSTEIKEGLEKYMSKELAYFGRESYFDENLEVLFTALNNYYYLVSSGYFLLKKKLLDYQVSLLKNIPNNA